MNELVQLNKEMLETLKQASPKPSRKGMKRKTAAKKKTVPKRKVKAAAGRN